MIKKYAILYYRIGVLAMEDAGMIEKLKIDMEEKKSSYEKELAKIKKEDMLLDYIKGMLAITENNVCNFPYYDASSKNQDELEAEEDFNAMLKYTLKEDKIIASFKSEIKNMYFLEKIGYKHAEQYEETKKKLEEYRLKISQAYEELIKNDSIKKIAKTKEQIIKRLDYLIEELQENKEVENIDKFYECLQYTNLQENEKTAVLLSVFQKNIILQQKKLTEKSNTHLKRQVERKIGKIKSENTDKLRKALKMLEGKFQIKVTFPEENNILGKWNNERFLFVEN